MSQRNVRAECVYPDTNNLVKVHIWFGDRREAIFRRGTLHGLIQSFRSSIINKAVVRYHVSVDNCTLHRRTMDSRNCLSRIGVVLIKVRRPSASYSRHLTCNHVSDTIRRFIFNFHFEIKFHNFVTTKNFHQTRVKKSIRRKNNVYLMAMFQF